MKPLMPIVLLSGAVSMLGCADGTPGGPGAGTKTTSTERKVETPATVNTPATDTTTTVNRPTYGEAEETFRISAPTLSTSLKQGESTTAKLSLSRGTNFDEDVTLSFENLPKGVTIEPTTVVIKHSDKEAEVMIQAAPDAALGDFKIEVIGHPTQGLDAKNEFTVTVSERG